MGDIYALDATLQSFSQDAPNSFAHDEYVLAHDMKQAVQGSDWAEVVTITKKPIFSFIEVEAVKVLKKVAEKEAAKQEAIQVVPVVPGPKPEDPQPEDEPGKKEQIMNSFL